MWHKGQFYRERVSKSYEDVIRVQNIAVVKLVRILIVRAFNCFEVDNPA